MCDGSKVMTKAVETVLPVVDEMVAAASEAEDPITKEQDRLAYLMELTRDHIAQVLFEIQDVSDSLGAPGMLRDSASVRFFSLFSQFRDQIKQIDAEIGAEIDTESMAKDRGSEHKIGRLQGMVQRYLERISERKANAEGKLVMLKRQLWASATDIAVLKKHAVTKEYVKETVSTQNLSGWVRELDKDEQGMPNLPDELKGAIKVTEKFSVSARKS